MITPALTDGQPRSQHRVIEVSFWRVLSSERLKLTTLPSQLVTTLVAFLLVLLAAALRLITTIAAQNTDAEAPSVAGNETLFPSQLLEGVVWAGILFAILSVLFMASEYTSGSIRTTILAVPTRTQVVTGKAAVLALTSFVIGITSSSLVLLAAWILAEQGALSIELPAPLSLRLVLGSGLYLAAISVLALALTAIIRDTVASLVTVLCLITVAPLLLAAVPVEWVRNLISFLPSVAGQLVLAPDGGSAVLTPWGGIGVLALWSALLLAAACVAVKKRDA
jgi:ABC-2 type transport system permease protein